MMRRIKSLPPEAIARLTGAQLNGDFVRACYCVRNHGDGTATIALDYYEMSIGRDFCGYDDFMRVELTTAREVVALLNAQLPGRVDAQTELDWSDSEGETP
jgi:hypothetical protein